MRKASEELTHSLTKFSGLKLCLNLALSIWHFDGCPPRARKGRGQTSPALTLATALTTDKDQKLEQKEPHRRRRVQGSGAWSDLCSSRRSWRGSWTAMDLRGMLHVEPISFGIDQILSSVEQSCMLGARMPEPDYGHGAYSCGPSSGGGGGGYTYGNSGYNGTGGSCGMASFGGAYQMNVGVNSNATNVSSAGVIRVPAHRPLSCGNSSGPPMTGNINNLTSLTFPWMESNRRYTKDRFTGIHAMI